MSTTPPATGREIELKLLFDDAGFDAAQRIDLLGAPRRGDRARLHASYFDTQDHALFRARMVLRVRSRGLRHVMTLKRAASAGAPVARPEVEVAVPGPEPEIGLLGPDAAAEVMALTGGAALQPAFSSDIHRAARIVPFRNSRIEAAFDTGTIVASDRREAVRELELELKQGEPSDLFALALQLLERMPARLGVPSKAERGFRLARGESAVALRAVSPLAPGHSLDDAIGGVIGACIQHFTGNWPAFEAGQAPDPVHQMRVAMRRLRAALALFQRGFPGVELGSFRADAKRIATTMGEARNWDVFAQMLREGPQTVLRDDAAFAALLEASERHRRAGYEDVAALLRAPDTTRFVLEVLDFVARRGWRNAVSAGDLPRLSAPAEGFAAHQLDRLRRRVRKRGRHIMRLSAEERHEVRLALKGLRYATDFFGGLFGDEAGVRAYSRASSRLQDVLGSFNDMAMVTDLVRRLDLGTDMVVARAGGIIIGWYGRGAQADLGRLRDAWDGFRKARPFWDDALKRADGN